MEITRDAKTIELAVEPGERGQRLDLWLSSKLPDMSRSRLQALIKAGCVTLNGKKSVKMHARVASAMRVTVTVPPVVPVEVCGENIPVDVIYEDSDIIVLNKQAGLVVHPAAGHPSGTLVNALLYHCRDLEGVGGELRPGIVHRLDKDTSGVMVVAKNERAMNILARQFKNKRVKKEYIAVIHGLPEPRAGRLETRIARSRSDRKKMSVTTAPAGRTAVTNYEVIEELGGFSVVRLRIETGRTHQIRVHMAHTGHPVAGDRQYGGRKMRKCDFAVPARQMLHAAKLSFIHPGSNRTVTFEAAIPDDIKEFIAGLMPCIGKGS